MIKGMGEKVEQKYVDATTNLAFDTLKKEKQALVFVNTKRSAEKVAEEIAKKIKEKNEHWSLLRDKALGVLGKPTRQCERLGRCLEKGIAFHHAGLHAKQKELIEDHFRSGTVRIICCTPTLAAGLDLPAFRTIIRDLKRYTGRGMAYIPVLEFLQMAGRAGRPKFDKYGESIVIAGTEAEKENLVDKYLHGDPEEIFSKLAVEPVLRTYVLSLISSQVVQEEKEVMEFFGRTFWAYQFEDTEKLEKNIAKMLKLLMKWEFLQKIGTKYRATFAGKRVAELYIDPLTAYTFIKGLKRAEEMKLKEISFLQLVSNALEMRPKLRVKIKEYDLIQEEIAKWQQYLLELEPSMFEPEYDDFLNGFKTALMLNEWIDEKDEEFLLEKYDVRPGETRAKLNTADWLLFALSELARTQEMQPILKEIAKVRTRLKYGVKEELLPLLKLQGIGRVRARNLFRAEIKDVAGLKKASLKELESILGKKMAANVKKQLGEKVEASSDRRRISDFVE